LKTNMLLLWMLALQLSCLTMATPSTQGVSQEGESMQPPRERFERSIPEQELKMKELLDNFKTEMLEKLQEQEQRIAEQEERILTQEEKNVQQDVKIARQSEAISQLEERIAEQQKTIEEQNETIQMIAKHPEIHDFLQGFKTEALSPGILAPTPTTTTTTAATTATTTIGSLLEDNILLITGGEGGSEGGSILSSTEVYPSTSSCSPPSLPMGRTGHTTFLTSEPSPLLATCGGVTQEGSSASCLVLDPINQLWNESRMGDLRMARFYGAVVTLNDIGVFIVGGYDTYNSETSEFLATGSMQWQEGPVLPAYMHHPCAVSITPTSFLAIHRTDIREFDTAIDGPTSREGWREAGHWPELKTSRILQPGCSKIGQKVIIAGGWNGGVPLRATAVLDLVDRRISSEGEMASPRQFFHAATIITGGEEKMFALAGLHNKDLNKVEEWVETSSTWKAADNLVEKREGFGSVAVPKQLICLG